MYQCIITDIVVYLIIVALYINVLNAYHNKTISLNVLNDNLKFSMKVYGDSIS